MAEVEDLAERVEGVLAELRDEYLQPHHTPWVIGTSWGKDSTLLVQLTVDMLLDLPRSQRKRTIHVVSNDTGVESPLVSTHVLRQQERLREGMEGLDLPVQVHLTQPDPAQTFWANLIGRGYPPPTRMFRWCTDRLKIRPTSAFVKAQVDAQGRVILLLGVRRAESAERARSVERHTVAGERLNPHGELRGCLVFRPILDLSTDDVWTVLMQRRPAWGGTHRELITLYRNAQGAGECPLVHDKASEPGCGTASPRFGCWTCTVVAKDRSMDGWVESGFERLEPLSEFRDWLKEIEHDPERRQLERRNGQISWRFDEQGRIEGHNLGPFTLKARAEILERLLATQAQVGVTLISEEEVFMVKRIWAGDACDTLTRWIAFSTKDG